MAAISIAHTLQAYNPVELLADVLYTRWRSFDQILIEFDNPAQPDVLQIQDYDDAFRFSLGLNYQYSPKVILRTGVAFDQTPVRGPSRNTARIPDTDRTWLSFGLGYKRQSGFRLIWVTHTSFWMMSPLITAFLNRPGPRSCEQASKAMSTSLAHKSTTNSKRSHYMTFKPMFLLVPAALLLQACSDDLDHDFQPGIDAQAAAVAANTPSQAVFNPGGDDPAIPFPSTLLFAGSTDGTVNIPVDDDTNLADPSVALNQLDGFSTISPIVTPMNSQLDPDTVVVGETIRIFEVEADVATGFASTGFIAELGAQDMVAIATPDNLILQPTQPLAPNTTFLVLLTDGLQNTNGAALERSLIYSISGRRNGSGSEHHRPAEYAANHYTNKSGHR